MTGELRSLHALHTLGIQPAHSNRSHNFFFTAQFDPEPLRAANLIGSIALVAAVYYAGVLPPLATSIGLAAKKVALPFHQVSREPGVLTIYSVCSLGHLKQVFRTGIGLCCPVIPAVGLLHQRQLEPRHNRSAVRGSRLLNIAQAFLRGILANWLVNIAIWQGTGSTSVPGKVNAPLAQARNLASIRHPSRHVFATP